MTTHMALPRRAGSVVAVIVLAVLMMTAPTAAAHTVEIGRHTTQSEFNAGAITNATTAPNPGDLVAMSTMGATTDRPNDNKTLLDDTRQWGLEIKPNTDLQGVQVPVSANTQGATEAYLYDANKNLIASRSITSGTARLYAPLESGKTYYVMLDDNGNTYDVGYNNKVNTPVTGTDVDITGYAVYDKGGTGWGTNTGQTRAWAKVTGIRTDGNATYAGTKYTASNVQYGWADLTLDNATATIHLQYNDGTGWQTSNSQSVSTSGNYTVAPAGSDGSTYDSWRIRVTWTTTEPWNYQAQLHDEGLTADSHATVLDNSSASPQNNTKLTSTPTYSINGSDADFATAQGDSVTLDWYRNGTLLGTTTETSNGTWTFTPSSSKAGDSQWHVEATDDYSHTTTSDTFLYQTPSQLYIRNESAPNELVNGTNTNVTVKFYGSDTVITRTTSDGTVDLSGVPADETIIVTAEASGFHSRHTIIKSLFEQQSVYLLNKSLASVEVRFKLDDATGNYDEEDSRVYIKRALNQSGSTSYKTIAADEFGVAGFTTDLKDGGRYRIIVENQQGDQRVLGSYTASVSETVTLTIGELTYDISGTGTGVKWDTAYQNRTTDRITFNYTDPTNNTTSLNLVIYERGNRSNFTIVNTTFNSGPYGTISFTEPLNATEEGRTYVVEWDAERDGKTIKGSRIIGATYGPGIPLDPLWKHTASVGFIIMVGGLVGGARPSVGAIVVSLMGGIMWFIGWLPAEIGGGAVALAIGIGVMFSVKREGI